MRFLGRRGVKRAALVAVALVGGAAGPSIGSAQAATPGIGWRACGDGLECARVAVPLDWSRPKGKQISLAVIRHPASDPGQRIGSMFFNPGGPGVSGVDTLRAQADTLDADGGGRFDVVSWDPRGTNASTHARCFASTTAESRFWGPAPFPVGAAQSRTYIAKTVAVDRRCGSLTTPGLLDHISTADTARDLDRLRALVSDRQLTYLGWSYGSMIGQTYANLFPRRVRAMVLDGIVDPVFALKDMETRVTHDVRVVDGVFARFEALCEQAGPDRCALAGHGTSVKDRVDAVLRRLRRGPLPAPTAEPPGTVTYAEALLALYGSINGPGGWPDMAAALEQAAEGDGSGLAKLGSVPDLRGTLVNSQAVHCADTPAGTRPQDWPAVMARLGRVSLLRGHLLGWWLWAPCTAWPTGHANLGRYTGPWNKRTARPIVVIGNRFDPATAYANAKAVARRLGNAVLLTLDGYGHTSDVDPSTCIRQLKTRYLTDLVAPPRGTVCPADRVPFDPDYGEPLQAPTSSA